MKKLKLIITTGRPGTGLGGVDNCFSQLCLTYLIK